ncbi:helix-turn-helix transcriptional regulator [Methylophaga sp.]|uniref:helix-turn-helix transcriptional regulator n=1 Tax=Methylophaga sp. TaxID=2024840 RepID=UPI003A924863
MRPARSYAEEIPETMTASDIAQIIGCSERNVKDRITKMPKFPKALKIGRNRVWIKAEFSEWFMKQREG